MSRHGMIAEDKQKVTIVLEKEILDQIDQVAAKIKISRNQLIKNIIIRGCDEIGIIDKIGVFGVVGFIRELKEKLQQREA